MPPLSLVVCVHKEREFLQRLLTESAGCHEDLVVVHDGPDTAGVRQVAERFHGRFYEQPRLGSLEAQSPFAWAQAGHDWILRLDADEFPSVEMKQWLRRFREEPHPGEGIAGYTCIWPLWSGSRMVTQRSPAGRIFLFHRQRVRFFGLVEQIPIPEGRYEPLPLVLHHRPNRKSYGLGNLLFRKQAFAWKRLIAQGLLGKPTDLPCWRWSSEEWPPHWEQVRQKPWRTGLKRLLLFPFLQARAMWREERKLVPSFAIGTGFHQCHIAIAFYFARLRQRRRSDGI